MRDIIKLIPCFKDYLWGGTRLRDEFGMKCETAKIAEAWELSCHPDGACYTESGETLAELIASDPELLGTHGRSFERFPLLIKLIDARDRLSVQVHPNDEYAKRDGESGKTEMWYVLDADEKAELVYGFKRELSHDEFARRIKDNTLPEVLNYVPVKKGDVFFIEAGTIHAIGAGILIAEIQQNSNATYRVYDYGRRGADGRLRELHVDKALDVTSLCPTKASKPEKAKLLDCGSVKKLTECDYFKSSEYRLDGEYIFNASPECFAHLLILDGNAEIKGISETISAKKGDSIFIPADVPCSVSGQTSLIYTTI